MTMTQKTACPDSETVGAFVEGRLGADERAEMTKHLDQCQPCRDEVAMLAGFAASGRTERATRSGWWLVAAASLVTVVGVALFWQSGTADHDRSRVASLVAAAKPLGYRLVEGRLSGEFGWAEFPGSSRSSAKASNPKELKLAGAAGTILDEAATDPEPEAQHAAAIASLWVLDPADAIDRLAKVTAQRPEDASAWSDLAAARHAAATRFGHPFEELLALAAANRALKIDPKLPEALFNRALIVEQLGLIFEARDAWTQYLEVDPNSEWAREARARRDALPETTNQSRFNELLPQLERDAAAGDSAAVAKFVARFPQQSRAMMEVEYLGRWGVAYRAGKQAEAERLLAITRSVGAALRAQSEEALLADTVAAIDAASPGTRTRLAEAHVTYREGRLAQSRRESEKARGALLHAADLFSGSVGSLNARYRAAVVSNFAGDVDIAEPELSELFAQTAGMPAYKALRAQVAWEYGIVQGKRARWPKALECYAIARELFVALGERGNGAVITSLFAEASMLLGRTDDAWQAWSESYRLLAGEGKATDLANYLSIASHAELVAGRADTASSLLDIEIHLGRQTGVLQTDMLFRRAMLSARAGDRAGAAAALAEGQRAAAEITDTKLRMEILADMQVAEGVAVAPADPRRGLFLLSNAVAYHETARPVLLPVALFARARVYRALGQIDEAERDLERAALAVEEHRETVEWRDARSGALDGVDQIYTTLAEVLLERGKMREAFAVADRAAAHAFYGASATESLVPLETLQGRLAPGSVVIEYLVLPRQLVAFVIGPRSFETRLVPIDAAGLTKRVAALDGALRDRAGATEVRKASAALFLVLIAPLQDLLRGAKSIAVVPDPAVASVAFPVLFDASSERWLIDDYAIQIVPAALYRDRAAANRQGDSDVVVIRPSAGEVDLPNATEEVAAIARLYPKANVIEGRVATVTSVLNAIGNASLIHYAGHSDSERDAGLVLNVADGRPELLYGSDIARVHLRRSPLVVLAGCRTLRGGARRDDLASSLARAFLLAGAHAVVGTSWDVDDAPAAAFFARFHELNAASGDPVAALRDAQRSMIHDPQRNIADWASAQIVVRSLDI